jgi:hypothetical protein
MWIISSIESRIRVQSSLPISPSFPLYLILPLLCIRATACRARGVGGLYTSMQSIACIVRSPF